MPMAGRPLVHNMRSTIVIIAVPAAHHTRPERVLQMSMYFAHQQQQQQNTVTEPAK